jgi:hypothetical protein
LLFFLGEIIALAIGACWISGTDGWNKIDSQHPGKALVLNMVRSVKPPLQYVVQRGKAFTARTKRVFEGFKDASTVVKTKPTAVREE